MKIGGGYPRSCTFSKVALGKKLLQEVEWFKEARVSVWGSASFSFLSPSSQQKHQLHWDKSNPSSSLDPLFTFSFTHCDMLNFQCALLSFGFFNHFFGKSCFLLTCYVVAHCVVDCCSLMCFSCLLPIPTWLCYSCLLVAALWCFDIFSHHSFLLFIFLGSSCLLVAFSWCSVNIHWCLKYPLKFLIPTHHLLVAIVTYSMPPMWYLLFPTCIGSGARR